MNPDYPRRTVTSRWLEYIFQQRIDKAFRREEPMAHDRIAMTPDIMAGKPVIRGTRIPVDMLLGKLDAGMTIDEILADHPHLTPEDIRAARAFATAIRRR